jgi:2-iminobutanoate/2-iminopropanoate deaminase
MAHKSVIANGLVPPRGPYAHAVIAGDYVFVSGLGPVNAKLGGSVVEGGIKEQTTQTLKNIRIVLENVGLEMEDVVRVGVYLRDLKDFEEFNSAYSAFFGENPPARTTVQCAIPNSKALVEIDAIAYKGTK